MKGPKDCCGTCQVLVCLKITYMKYLYICLFAQWSEAFLFSVQSRMVAQEMVPPTVKVSLPTYNGWL